MPRDNPIFGRSDQTKVMVMVSFDSDNREYGSGFYCGRFLTPEEKAEIQHYLIQTGLEWLKAKRKKEMTQEYDIENIFTYHAPKEGQPLKYTLLRNRGKMLALDIMDQCPESRERSLALTKLEECLMWANAAIARHG